MTRMELCMWRTGPGGKSPAYDPHAPYPASMSLAV